MFLRQMSFLSLWVEEYPSDWTPMRNELSDFLAELTEHTWGQTKVRINAAIALEVS